MEINYLTVEEVLLIHRIIDQVFAGYEDQPVGKKGVRAGGETLLHSALFAPSASFGGKDCHPTIHEKAAALLRSLALNHPFLDGNKRTALLATIIFLDNNGYDMYCDDDKAVKFMLKVVKFKPSPHRIAQWLRNHSEKKRPPKPTRRPSFLERIWSR